MSEYLMEFKTNKEYMEMNIQEGSTIPRSLVYVCLTDKGLTKQSKLDPSIGDVSKSYEDCFYTTTINNKDYCAVGRCHISPINNNPTGNFETLEDKVFNAWVLYFGSSSFYAPSDLEGSNTKV